MEIKDRVRGKLLLKGQVLTCSPLLIGGSSEGEADTEVLLDDHGHPYIPASSFAGMFSSHFKNHTIHHDHEVMVDAFFGSMSTEDGEQSTYQSHFSLNDLFLVHSEAANMEIRDGVEISPVWGVAENGSKYSYEMLAAGAAFNFEAEVTLRDGLNRDYFLKMINYLCQFTDELRLGSLTSFGFGRWKWNSFEVFETDFTDGGLGWLQYQQSRFSNASVHLNPVHNLDQYRWSSDELRHNSFKLEAQFSIKNTLMIGHYGISPDEVDKTSIKSNQMPVLPGKSLKGALRHRAYKILHTLAESKENNDAKVKVKELMDELMGAVDKVNKSKKKSRLRIEETLIQGAETEQVQPRIKVDPFTGGAEGSALFNSQPLFHEKETLNIALEILDYRAEEAGLLLLLLKDLWEGDLPIGGEKNIGRGVFIGERATLKFAGQEMTFSEPRSLSEKEKQLLESNVQTLVELLN